MRHSLATICPLLILLCVSAASAKEKERQWQTGRLLDMSRSSGYAGDIGSASGSATTTGDSTCGTASGSSVAIYRVYETYQIESADYIYVCVEHIKWRWSKPAALTVNGPVQFATEGNHIYIKSEDGSEHETKITKKIAITAPDTSFPSQTETQSTVPAPAVSQAQVREKGTVTVTTFPDGADIYADSAFVGNGPAVLKLPEGKHTIRVSMAGYKDWSREISVLAGSEVKLTAVLGR